MIADNPIPILIVDDEETLRRSLVEGLSLFGDNKYEAICVASVDEALSLLSDWNFGAIVTDLRMPGKDGLQLLLELRKRSQKIPTIVMTAYGSPNIHAQAARQGAVRYIEKPFQLEQLIQFLDDVTSTAAQLPKISSPLDIIEILELLCMGNKDMAVDVQFDRENGRIYVKNGEIVHAEFGDLSGTDALFELLNRTQARISTDPEGRAGEETISQGWQELTEDAWRRRTFAPLTKPEVEPDAEHAVKPDTEPAIQPLVESATNLHGGPTAESDDKPEVSEKLESEKPPPKTLPDSTLLPPWSGLETELVISRAVSTLPFTKKPHVLKNRGEEGSLVGIVRKSGLGLSTLLGLGSLLGCVIRTEKSASLFLPLNKTNTLLAICGAQSLVEEQIIALAEILGRESPPPEESLENEEAVEEEGPPEQNTTSEDVETVHDVVTKQLRAFPKISGVTVTDFGGRILSIEDSDYGEMLGAVTPYILDRATKLGESLSLGSMSYSTATCGTEGVYFLKGWKAMAALETDSATTPWAIAENAAGILSVL